MTPFATTPTLVGDLVVLRPFTVDDGQVMAVLASDWPGLSPA